MLFLSSALIGKNSKYSAIPDMLFGAAFALLVNNGDKWFWTSTGEPGFVTFDDNFAKFKTDQLVIERTDRKIPLRKVVDKFTDEEVVSIFWEYSLLAILPKNESDYECKESIHSLVQTKLV